MTVPRVAHVTPAQNRVLVNLLTDGADNPEIAARLYITPDTVKSHMRSLMRAFGVNNRTALVCAYYRGTVRVCVLGEEL